MDTEAFKKDIKPRLAAAIEAQGGIDRVRQVHSSWPGIVDFIAGWVVRDLGRPASLEEMRRIYDLVRLAINSDSATS
jgi:hypothetical protein